MALKAASSSARGLRLMLDTAERAVVRLATEGLDTFTFSPKLAAGLFTRRSDRADGGSV
jgi:hypothetical protein